MPESDFFDLYEFGNSKRVLMESSVTSEKSCKGKQKNENEYFRSECGDL